MSESKHLCPACKRPLNIVATQDSNLVTLYCRHGECPSPKAMNEGRLGCTEAEAADALRDAYSAELDAAPGPDGE